MRTSAAVRKTIAEAAPCDVRRLAGEDPRRAIAHLNERIVDCQSRGLELPASLIRLCRTLTAQYGVRGSPG